MFWSTALKIKVIDELNGFSENFRCIFPLTVSLRILVRMLLHRRQSVDEM